MSIPKPTLIFVPGAWHTPGYYTKTTTILSTHSQTCITIPLPTASSDASKTFLDDLAAVREAIASETSQGRDVVVVMHSYGGVVGASAIKGFTKKDSPSSSQGHVLGLILIASGFIQTGISFLAGMGGTPPPSWTLDHATGLAVLVADPRELFYHDLDEEEGRYWVSKLEKQSLKAFTEGGDSAYAGWMDVPVWYLATLEDKALPVEVQKMMVKGAQDAGGEVEIREVGSGHSVMLSKPEETVRVIEEAVEAFVGKKE